MKLLHEDNGNCRVYYRDERNSLLYCYQDDGSWGRTEFKLYICSRDGEPSHEVPLDASFPLPNGETSVGRKLREFLEMKRAISC